MTCPGRGWARDAELLISIRMGKIMWWMQLHFQQSTVTCVLISTWLLIFILPPLGTTTFHLPCVHATHTLNSPLHHYCRCCLSSGGPEQLRRTYKQRKMDACREYCRGVTTSTDSGFTAVTGASQYLIMPKHMSKELAEPMNINWKTSSIHRFENG